MQPNQMINLNQNGPQVFQMQNQPEMYSDSIDFYENHQNDRKAEFFPCDNLQNYTDINSESRKTSHRVILSLS